MVETINTFTDNFARSDSATIGNGWSDHESTPVPPNYPGVGINALQARTYSDGNYPTCTFSRAFPTIPTGHIPIKWELSWEGNFVNSFVPSLEKGPVIGMQLKPPYPTIGIFDKYLGVLQYSDGVKCSQGLFYTRTDGAIPSLSFQRSSIFTDNQPNGEFYPMDRVRLKIIRGYKTWFYEVDYRIRKGIDPFVWTYKTGSIPDFSNAGLTEDSKPFAVVIGLGNVGVGTAGEMIQSYHVDGANKSNNMNMNTNLATVKIYSTPAVVKVLRKNQNIRRIAV